VASTPPITGTPVSPDEVEELKTLRKAFDPDASLKTLEAFAVWLFASSGTLGALATAGKVVGIGDLSDDGKSYFSYAAILFGVSLALAVLAKAPQPARFNPHSVVAMRSQLNRIMITRSVLLIAAAGLFAVALGLAAFAPLATTRAQGDASSSLTYALSEDGRLVAMFNVVKAKRFSTILLTSAARPAKARRVLPRATAFTDGRGRAHLTLKVARRGARVVVFRGTWILPEGGQKKITVRVPLGKQ
jgi:hypothetical protein